MNNSEYERLVVHKVAISTGALCGVLDRLETKTLIERRHAPGDRRTVVVRVTGIASDWFVEDLSLPSAEFSNRFAALSGDEKESILKVLHKLAVMLGDPSCTDSITTSADNLKDSGIPLEHLIIGNRA